MVTMKPPPPWTVKVLEALEAQGRTRAWLAEEMGVSRALMTRLLKGERRAKSRHLRSIAHTLGIPAHWLTDET